MQMLFAPKMKICALILFVAYTCTPARASDKIHAVLDAAGEVDIAGHYSSTPGGSPVAAVSSSRGEITFQFLDSDRPVASGNFDPAALSGHINFEDVKAINQFTFDSKTGIISWDDAANDNLYRVSSVADTGTVSVSGYYSGTTNNGQPNAVITSDTTTNEAISVRFLNSNRPIAHGNFDPLTLSGSVNFVDDRVYQFTFNPTSGVITWDGPVWYRVLTTVSVSGYYSGTTNNGQPNAVITSDTTTNKAISVRFLNSNRPIAHGNFDPLTLSGSVNFVDDRVYQFTFNPTSGVITWDGPVWYRVLTTVSVSGYYSGTTNNGQPNAVITSDTTTNKAISVRFLNSNRPIAHGNFDPLTLSGSVDFVDDRVYQFTFNPTSGVITWDGPVWYRVLSTVSVSGYYSGTTNNGQPNAVITSDTTTNEAISVRFLNSNRPIAHGNFDPLTLSGSVDFVDDRVYQFTFNPTSGVITWDGPVWYRVLTTVSVSGYYSGTTNNGQPNAVITSDTTTNEAISVRFLNSNRPIAHGNFDPLTLSGSVDFVDDRVYQFTFNPTSGVITWDGPVWYRVLSTVSVSGYYSGTTNNGQPNAVITSDTSTTNSVIAVKFLNSNRPTAQGKFDQLTLSGSVNFVDDRVYQFTFNPISGVITWDGAGNTWYRIHIEALPRRHRRFYKF